MFWHIHTEEKVGKQKDQPSLEKEDKALCKEEENQTLPTETSVDVSTKSASEIEEESPSFGSDSSTWTDESGKVEVVKISNTAKQEKPTRNDKVARPSPFYSTLLSKKSKKRNNNVTIDEKAAGEGDAGAVELCKTPTSEPQSTKSKNNTSSTSKMLKNLITCGDVETNDSAVLPVKKQNKPFLSMCSSDVENVYSATLRRRDSGFGGSQRVFGNPTWTYPHQYFSGRYFLPFI